MKSMKIKLLQIFILAGLMLFPVASPAAAHHCFGHQGAASDASNNIAECLDAGACLNTTGANCPNQSLAESRLERIIRTVVNLFSIIVGVVAVVMVIVSGLKYVTSAGDSASVNSAKNTLLYAVVGLIVVALAQIIVRFVLAKVG